jgi:hypothetical protein
VGVVGIQVGAIERPAGVVDTGTDLEVDRVQRWAAQVSSPGPNQCLLVPPNAHTRDWCGR